MRKLILLILFVIFPQSDNQAYALSVETHEAINEYIVRNNMNGFSLDAYLQNNVGLITGITTTINTEQVWQWFRDGGRYEDAPPGYWPPYRRSRNHFHNPLLPWAQAYYTDWFAFCSVTDNPFLISDHCPESAILWALGPQNSDIDGIDFNPGGDWSWKETRQTYYEALTSASTVSDQTKMQKIDVNKRHPCRAHSS